MNGILQPQYIISFFALLISISSFVFAIKSWYQSNRPIVVAYIKEELMGTNGGAFSLVLANTGNRPATNIKIVVEDHELNNIFEEDTNENSIQIVKNIFKEESRVALLINGTEIITSFGHFEIIGGKHQGLKYDSWLPITIEYNDLNCRSYLSKLRLKIRGLEGFGGGIWK